MRVLFGIILGVALTVSVAFISDTWSTGPATTGSGSATVEHRNMVNWDVVGDNTRIARERLHAAWNRLSIDPLDSWRHKCKTGPTAGPFRFRVMTLRSSVRDRAGFPWPRARTPRRCS